MFSVLKSGGILMIPIVLCGIFATFIIIERIRVYIPSLNKDNIVIDNSFIIEEIILIFNDVLLLPSAWRELANGYWT